MPGRAYTHYNLRQVEQDCHLAFETEHNHINRITYTTMRMTAKRNVGHTHMGKRRRWRRRRQKHQIKLLFMHQNHVLTARCQLWHGTANGKGERRWTKKEGNPSEHFYAVRKVARNAAAAVGENKTKTRQRGRKRGDTEIMIAPCRWAM